MSLSLLAPKGKAKAESLTNRPKSVLPEEDRATLESDLSAFGSPLRGKRLRATTTYRERIAAYLGVHGPAPIKTIAQNTGIKANAVNLTLRLGKGELFRHYQTVGDDEYADRGESHPMGRQVESVAGACGGERDARYERGKQHDEELLNGSGHFRYSCSVMSCSSDTAARKTLPDSFPDSKFNIVIWLTHSWEVCAVLFLYHARGATTVVLLNPAYCLS